jgi:hypothetical protein
MSYDEMSEKLAGPIGLMKQYVTLIAQWLDCATYAIAIHTRFVSRCSRETAEDSTQIFGGRAITTSGMGKVVENVCVSPVIAGLSPI